MYNFSPTSGPYFYPWDMPAMFFFTLAVLFFERRKIWIMAVAICAGAFFKETALVCALLIFFVEKWKWTRKVLVFAVLIAVYVAVKKLLLSHLELLAPMFSPADALRLRGSFSPSTFEHNVVENLKALFSPTLNSIFFVNAGTLAAVLALGWQRRFLPYMTVIIVFIGGLFLFGPPPGISEVRDFMEVLPLSILLLSILWAEHFGLMPATVAATGSLWAVRPTFHLLAPIVIAVIVLTTSIASVQYNVLYQDLQPANQSQSPLGKFVYNSGKTATLEALAQLFRNGYADTALKLGINDQLEHRDKDAEAQYRDVLQMDTNSIYAMNNLATLLATDSDPRLRDGGRAVKWARRACELTQYHEPALIYTLAASYAEAGRFADAIAAAEQARALALQRGENRLVGANEPLVNLYKTGHPFHQQ
ncbi:MAG: tetratricopeptide repeat protein, partial [Limisphaerales bacterium]